MSDLCAGMQAVLLYTLLYKREVSHRNKDMQCSANKGLSLPCHTLTCSRTIMQATGVQSGHHIRARRWCMIFGLGGLRYPALADKSPAALTAAGTSSVA